MGVQPVIRWPFGRIPEEMQRKGGDNNSEGERDIKRICLRQKWFYRDKIPWDVYEAFQGCKSECS